jgi:hypothetical protein
MSYFRGCKTRFLIKSAFLNLASKLLFGCESGTSKRPLCIELGQNKAKIRFAFTPKIIIFSHQLGNLSNSGPGRSSGERSFSDDLKPDGREQPGKSSESNQTSS